MLYMTMMLTIVHSQCPLLCTRGQRNKLLQHRERTCQLVKCNDKIHAPTVVYVIKCKSLAAKITNDAEHPLDLYYISLL